MNCVIAHSMKHVSSAWKGKIGFMKHTRSIKTMRAAKYGNRKISFYGIEFDSQKEAYRYLLLRDLQKQGRIHNLELQKEFELIPEQRIGGKLVERAVKYIADFTYNDHTGAFVVEDTKGFKTQEYIIKRKLMLFIHNIKINEI